MPDWMDVAGIIGGLFCVIPLAVTFVGFGPSGIVAGSTAAAIQSSMGNVAVGSTFAALQSMGTSGLLVKTAVLGGATSVGVYAQYIYSGGKELIGHLFSKIQKKDEEQENENSL